jgi:hypothetical protein
MQEIFMKEHVGDDGPWPACQLSKVSRNCKQQEEIRIAGMPVQEVIENLYKVYENEESQVNLD